MKLNLTIFFICVSSIATLFKGVVGEKSCRCKPKDSESTAWLMCSNVTQDFQISIQKSWKCQHYRPSHLFINDSDIPTLTAQFFGDIEFHLFENVNFTSCGIRNITTDAFSNFTKLTVLSLQYNKLTEDTLTASLKSIRHLRIKTLYLDGNNLKILKNESFRSIGANISSLQMSKCGIEHIEHDFLRWLPNLKKINFNNNSLQEVNFLGVEKVLCNIIDVQLRNNFIRNADLFRFEPTMPCLRKIISLSLDGNPVESLDLVNKLRNLNLLYAQRITCTEEGQFPIFTVPLTVLHLGNNNITCWRKDMFSKLKTLTSLSLSGTDLADVSSNFLLQLFLDVDMITLKLPGTRLRNIPQNLFRNMISLQYLYLNDNYIFSLEGHLFSGLDHLVDVSLHNNNISVIMKDSLPMVNNSLDISDNPFLCSCDLVDFRQYFEHNKGILMKKPAGSYTCARPSKWKDKDLQSFRPEYTDCNAFNPYVIAAFCTCGFLTLLAIIVNVCTVCRKDKDEMHVPRQPKRKNLYQSFDENTSHEY